MVVVLAVVGFVTCADKHRVKEALWQRFLYNLTLAGDGCSELSIVPKKFKKWPARRVSPGVGDLECSPRLIKFSQKVVV